MCGCFVALVALISPRFAIFLVWLFDRDRMSAAFDSWFVAFLGFLFLPWTTLAYVIAWQPGGLNGNWDALLIVLGVTMDIVTYMHRFAAKSVQARY